MAFLLPRLDLSRTMALPFRRSTGTRYFALALFALAGCESSERDQAVVDTAQVIAAPSRTFAPPDGFDGVPMTSVLLADGGVIGVDSRSATLHVFDSTGALVRSIGRRGHGPGEFQEVSDVFEVPSSGVAIYDQVTKRLTLMGRDGSTYWTHLLDRWPNTQSMRVIGAFDSSEFVGVQVRETAWSPGQPAFVDDSIDVLVGTPDSTPRTILTLAGRQSLHVIDGGTARSIIVPGSSRMISVCSGGLLFIRDSLLEQYDRQGQLASRMSLPSTVVPRSAADIEALTTRITTHLSPTARTTATRLLGEHLRDKGYVSGIALVDENADAWMRMAGPELQFARYRNGTVDVAIGLSSPVFWLHAMDRRLLAISPETDSSGPALKVFEVAPGGHTSSSQVGTQCSRPARL